MHKIYKTHKGKIFNPEKISDDCWIDINSPTEDEIFNIKSKINIPEEFLASIRDIDEVPKFEKEDNLNFILIQTPVMHEENGKDDEPEINFSIAPLGIIYTSNLILTISEGKNDVIEYLKLKLKNYTKNRIIHTDDIPQMILKLILFTEKLYLRYSKIINQKIRAAQSNLEQSPKNEEIINLMNLEKSLVYFSTSLHSNNVVFEKISKRKFFTSNEENEELVEDILDESKQAIETVKIYGKIINNISTTFASIISNNLNRTVKLLTSMTIILMIPTLVASVYGMNVALPFQSSSYAFWITVSISIGMASLVALILFRKNLF